MEFLTTLLENSSMPWLTALLLGLMTAISPCPLATNITAVGFIGRDIENRNRVFVNGLLYTLGRAVSYTVLALIIYLGADQLKFSGFFQRYGEKVLGPLLIIIGLLMLDVFKIKFPGVSKLTSRMETKTHWGTFDSILLGMIFALAFCQWCPLLWNAHSTDNLKRIRSLSALGIRLGYRYSCHPLFMVAGFFNWFNRHNLQQAEKF
jgi:cytochrome c-type biogenesis protein